MKNTQLNTMNKSKQRNIVNIKSYAASVTACNTRPAYFTAPEPTTEQVYYVCQVAFKVNKWQENTRSNVINSLALLVTPNPSRNIQIHNMLISDCAQVCSLSELLNDT